MTTRRTKTAAFHTNINPDHSKALKRINRVIGQLQGIQRMITDRRYCPEILTQTRAAGSALESLELQILRTHLTHCVTDAIKARDSKESAKKIDEIIKLFERF